MSRSHAILALTGAWVAVGVLVGTAEWFTVYQPRGLSWAAAVRGPVVAGVLWVPLTLGAIAAGRWWPILPVRPRGVIVHLALAAATSFVLNVAFNIVFFTLGWAEGPPLAMLGSALASGIQLLHLNAGAYLAIVVIAALVPRQMHATAMPASSSAPATTFAVRTGQETTVIPVDEVDWIEGAGDYARLHVGDRQYLLGERLKVLETRLDPNMFARVHRSAIVNLSRVRRLRHRSHGDYDAVLTNGAEVRVSRTYRSALAQLLGTDAGASDVSRR